MKRGTILTSICLGALIAASSAHATSISLTFTSSTVVGTVDPGTPGSGGQQANDIIYVNQLAGMALNTSTGPISLGDGTENFTRSGNLTSPLPTAITGNVQLFSGLNGNGSLGAIGTGFTYIIGKYDGPHDVAVVWDIAGLNLLATDTITIPGNGPNGLGLSGVTIFDATTTTNHTGVPDGASTVTLLGAVLTGMGLFRNKFAKS